MSARHVLILRLYSRNSNDVASPLLVCEDPSSGERMAFANGAELWNIVQAKLAKQTGSRTRSSAAERERDSDHHSE